MAPKAKKDKVSEEEIQSLCLDYLSEQNRPYNAQDVALNLHERFSRTAALKALQALADKGAVDCKESGDPPKRSILTFCAKQDQEDTLDSAALLELDKQIISLTDEISALRHDNQKLNQDLKVLCLEKSTQDLVVREQELIREIATANSRLEEASSRSRKLYSASDAKRIDDDYMSMRAAHKRHMKEFEHIFDTLCEGLEKSRKEAIEWREELGIDEVEQDEEYRWLKDPLSAAVKKIKS